LENEIALTASSDRLCHVQKLVELESQVSLTDWGFKYRLRQFYYAFLDNAKEAQIAATEEAISGSSVCLRHN
jgi:hypothetical protein